MDSNQILKSIEINTHSSIRIASPYGVLYIDPLQIEGQPQDADIILVTHDHYDHFSPEDIRKIATPKSILVVPKKMEEKAKEVQDAVQKIETVQPNGQYEIGGLPFETIPAYNNLKPFHPKKAEWVGYILLLEGQRVYIAGDTDLTKENRAVACDIAMVPIGGTYTMDAKKAAELINTIRPKAVIPTHYGTIVGKASDVDSFAALVDPAVQLEKKLIF